MICIRSMKMQMYTKVQQHRLICSHIDLNSIIRIFSRNYESTRATNVDLTKTDSIKDKHLQIPQK